MTEQNKQEPFCYVNVNKQGDVTRTTKRKDAWCKTPLWTGPQPAIPEGYVLVPVEPTEAMELAGEKAALSRENPRADWATHMGAVYRAMIAAAQKETK